MEQFEKWAEYGPFRVLAKEMTLLFLTFLLLRKEVDVEGYCCCNVICLSCASELAAFPPNIAFTLDFWLHCA